jgi:hypothetical protein
MCRYGVIYERSMLGICYIRRGYGGDQNRIAVLEKNRANSFPTDLNPDCGIAPHATTSEVNSPLLCSVFFLDNEL